MAKRVPIAGCPLDQCAHLGMAHDVEELDPEAPGGGTKPTCTVATCTCGKAPGSEAFRRAKLTELLEHTALASHSNEWRYVRDAVLVPEFLAWAEGPMAAPEALARFAELCDKKAADAERNADLVRARPMLIGQEKMLRRQVEMWRWAAAAARAAREEG